VGFGVRVEKRRRIEREMLKCFLGNDIVLSVIVIEMGVRLSICVITGYWLKGLWRRETLT
jgi:hypothetical protein